MKPWTLIAACLVAAAACTDGQQPLEPRTDDLLPVHALGLAPEVSMDPVLAAAINLASPEERLEVLVTYDEALTTGDAVASALSAAGAGIIRFRHLPTVFALATPAQVAAASRLPGVRSLWANRQLRWLLREGIPSVGADLAHAAGYTGAGVGIAILDSGIDGLHSPDLVHPTRTVQNVKYLVSVEDAVTFGSGVPAVGGDLYVENLASSETSVGHGTHVAGIAAGDGTASSGFYRGVAPGADLVGIGAGDVLFVFWVLAGFDYILENQARYNIQVVNNSWGTTGAFDPADPTNVATKTLYDRGIAVVFAAGNEGPGAGTMNPYGTAPWVISVAAGCKTVEPDPTNSAAYCRDGRSRLLADFSSRGVAGEAHNHPDVTAPGVSVVSTRSATGTVMNVLDLPWDARDCNLSLQNLPYYTCADGTSMAAPFVAGTIALMEEAAKGRLTPDEAYRAITRTAHPMPGYAEWEVGAGYLDVYAAVRAVRRNK
jgi:serine protease AprX